MPDKNDNLFFPPTFLWGASTSAYQIEGGNTNDWSQWENNPSRIATLKQTDKNPADYICNLASNSYHMFDADLQCIEELNLSAYRFSLEWSRLEPRPGEFSSEAIAYYHDVLQKLKAKNIKTVVTLWHWTNPLWISDVGGWTKKETVQRYLDYVAFVVAEFGPEIDYWVTLNEPMIHVSNGYLSGKFPPQKKNPFAARKVFYNLLQAHREAYQLIHQEFPNAQVSFTQLINYFEPAHSWNLLENILAWSAHYFWNIKFLNQAQKYLDYIGVDYYFHNRITFYPPWRKNLNQKVNDLGWEIYPLGLYAVLKYLAKFKKPIIILENGLADAADIQRSQFIIDHLTQVHRAISEGVDVRGYFHWSLIDNFEWTHGFIPKFGLYAVDRQTWKRLPRASSKLYAQICKTNTINQP